MTRPLDKLNESLHMRERFVVLFRDARQIDARSYSGPVVYWSDKHRMLIGVESPLHVVAASSKDQETPRRIVFPAQIRGAIFDAHTLFTAQRAFEWVITKTDEETAIQALQDALDIWAQETGAQAYEPDFGTALVMDSFYTTN